MQEKKIHKSDFDKSFSFESYGVIVSVESDNEALLDEARKAAKRALVDEFRIVENQNAPHRYGVRSKENLYFLSIDGVEHEHGDSLQYFLKYFSSLIRITIAEYAVDRVFVHAGVVGWKGKAILMPANSFQGKSTLVAELIRNGAVYYSDDYAVLDKEGLVHPFARLLSIRNGGWERERIDITEISAESLGGTVGIEPLQVGFILFTEYARDAVWKPEFLTPGNGAIEMISQTIPIRYDPEFALKVLKKVTSRAIIVKSARNDAKFFAKLLIHFIDNTSY